jgi:hypothetical protein
MSVSTEINSMQPAGKPKENPLKGLLQFGQSVWLDYIRRDLIATGELARLIKEDGLRGMTSNPAIFEKAIAGSTDYAQALDELAKRKDLDAKGIFEQIAIRDIQDAADALRPVYDESKRRDGYVSLEVSPYLAHKTEETIEEARRLWKSVGRANLMIKVLRPRRTDAARSLGQHRHEEPRLQRHSLRRGVDWPRYGEHDSAGHVRCVSRSRPPAAQPRIRSRRGARDDGQSRPHGNFDEGSHRPPHR